MTLPKEEPRLLYRYDRYDDGSIRLNRPYDKGTRDDSSMMVFDCLAFKRDLSGLPESKRKEFLDFEKAYINFYRLWTGSHECEHLVSRSLDLLQRDFEGLRRLLDATLEQEHHIPTYPMLA